ncbi:MAG: alpha/beta hydrolase [Actinomycetota bacterium]|nr:alpha/beta hydrolase [Actinomycetota bacterium]
MVAITQGSVSANGVDFAFLQASPPATDTDDHCLPLALCLHGFPDSAHGWRHLLPALADAGYRAVAPFQRGYAPTSVPPDGRYQSGVLGVDANALHEALGGDERAVIVGHDWGASGTYAAAVLQPQRWRKVVAMAVPTGGAMVTAFLGDLAQLKRSWYMFFFQSGIADLVVPGADMAFIDMLWHDWSPGYDATDDLVHVKQCLRDPANLAAALGYYRATLGAGLTDPALAEAQAATQGLPVQPLLYLHGRNDGCVGVDVATGMAAVAPSNFTIEVVDDAGHFLHLERPQLVNERIVSFLA